MSRAKRRNEQTVKWRKDGTLLLVRRLSKDFVGTVPTGRVHHPALVRKVSQRGEVHYD